MYQIGSYRNALFASYTRTKLSNDYYPFGSSLPTRSWSDASRVYRYGFNGKEKDSETANDDYDFGARIYDGRLGRWLSLDPLMVKYPFFSPYIGIGNNPILYIDIDGKDIIINPTIYKYDGPLVPTCLAQLAKTVSETNLVLIGGIWTLTQTNTIHFSEGYTEVWIFNGSEPGFDNFIHTHEEEHVKRSVLAANKTYSYVFNNQNYIGTIDVIMSKIYNDNFKGRLDNINAEYERKKSEINSKYEKNIEDAKASRDNVAWQKAKKERKEALKKVEEDKNTEIVKLEEEVNKVKNDLLDLFDNDQKENNNDEDVSSTGVIKTAEKNMSREGKKVSKMNINNQRNEKLESCTN